MNKLSHDQVANHFYNLGVQAALGGGMDKTAGLSVEKLHKLLSAGPSQSAALGKAMGQRYGGQSGTLVGGGMGGLLGATATGNPVLDALLGLGGAAGGAALGNIAGRGMGGLQGQLGGYIGGLAPFRATGNFLADPLRRVPGIRG